MLMRLVLGAWLVIASWLVVLLVLTALGRWLAISIQPEASRRSISRASLWLGLLIATGLTLLLSLSTPLRFGMAGLLFLGAVITLGTVGLVMRRPSVPSRGKRNYSPTVIAVVISLAVAIAYLSLKALGPVTNYDSGLYHLGAIQYAGDFSSIPGLANLYFPFGYGNSQFPLAALLGNGPWDGIGYRLLNGALIVVASADLVLRLVARRRTWGTWVLIIGLGATLIPLVGLSDFLVTSPTSDTAVWLLTLVSSAYLVDFLSLRRERCLNASVLGALLIVMVSMRPTMVFFAVASLGVVAAALWRQRSWPGVTGRGWVFAALSVVLMGSLIALRDRVLSGWLLYPLSLFAFDVPWLSEDPTAPREATLAAARNPFDRDQYSVAHSWEWIGSWLSRLGSQWETYFLALAALLSAVVWLMARRRANFPQHPRRLAASLLPSAVAVLTWFLLTPPSFRFIWGPLFCLAFIPLGAALHALDSSGRAPSTRRSPVTTWTPLVLAGTLLLVTAFCVVARNQVSLITEERTWSLGSVSIPYAVAPVPLPPVTPFATTSGLMLISPETGSDQCWGNYPLCTPAPHADLALRGVSLQDGLERQ